MGPVYVVVEAAIAFNCPRIAIGDLESSDSLSKKYHCVSIGPYIVHNEFA